METGTEPYGMHDEDSRGVPECPGTKGPEKDSAAPDWQRHEAEIVELARRRANPPRIRPLGVMVLSMLLAIYSVCLFMATLWTWSHLDEVRASMTADNSPDIVWAVVIAVPFQMLAAAAISYGLWDLEGWARPALLSFAALGLTRRSALFAYPPFVTPYLPGLGFSPAFFVHLAAVIGLWLYLRSSDVRTAFSENRKFGD